MATESALVPDGAGRPAGPLTGLRVLEFEAIGPGPFAGMMLADMGARITEVLFEVGGQYRHDM